MSLVFTGLHAAFHHQCFKMADVLIDYCEQHVCGLNPHTKTHVPLEQEETHIKNNCKGKGSEENVIRSEENIDAENENKDRNKNTTIAFYEK